MSTYAIADAINKFADNFKYAIGAKNQIEKERLEFEKEKFEFSKQQSDTNDKQDKHELECKCKHDWRFVGSVQGTVAMYRVYVCPICGAQQTEKTIKDSNGVCHVCLIDETGD
jgi:hypothetical protein